MATKKITYGKCSLCGVTLDFNNTYIRQDGRSRRCRSCEEKMYSRLSNECGAHIGLFSMCAATNTPFFPLLLPEVEEFSKVENKWAYYNNLLKEQGYVQKPNGQLYEFFDGATNILQIFGRNLSEKDTANYCFYELERIERLAGTPEQREKWGTQPLCKNFTMTSEVYDDLDAQYEIWEDRYKGLNSPELENNIIRICKQNMIADFLLRNGNYADAQKVQKMCDDFMASEQMRKKDEKPVEELRLDALVVALESYGAMENKQFKKPDELIKIMRDKSLKSKKYDYSLDACDQMINDYYNNIRLNSDLPIVSELPEDMEVVDEYGEFAPEESEEEKQAKRYANLTPVTFGNEGV